jgi:hypothetical protein
LATAEPDFRAREQRVHVLGAVARGGVIGLAKKIGRSPDWTSVIDRPSTYLLEVRR